MTSFHNVTLPRSFLHVADNQKNIRLLSNKAALAHDSSVSSSAAGGATGGARNAATQFQGRHVYHLVDGDKPLAAHDGVLNARESRAGLFKVFKESLRKSVDINMKSFEQKASASTLDVDALKTKHKEAAQLVSHVHQAVNKKLEHHLGVQSNVGLSAEAGPLDGKAFNQTIMRYLDEIRDFNEQMDALSNSLTVGDDADSDSDVDDVTAVAGYGDDSDDSGDDDTPVAPPRQHRGVGRGRGDDSDAEPVAPPRQHRGIMRRQNAAAEPEPVAPPRQHRGIKRSQNAAAEPDPVAPPRQHRNVARS